jgi:hypothetical protein
MGEINKISIPLVFENVIKYKNLYGEILHCGSGGDTLVTPYSRFSGFEASR